MLDKKLVHKKLEAMRLYMEEIKPILVQSFANVYKNYRDLRALERDFQLIVDAAVDINMHIILENGKPPPETNFHSFLILGELHVLSGELAKGLAPSAGLRNKLVHEYEKIDPYILFRSVQKFYKLYQQYCRRIMQELKQ